MPSQFGDEIAYSFSNALYNGCNNLFFMLGLKLIHDAIGDSWSGSVVYRETWSTIPEKSLSTKKLQFYIKFRCIFLLKVKMERF